MFDYQKFLLGAGALLCAQVVNAVVPEVEVWSDGTHYRYLLGDYHIDYIDGRNTVKQREDILWAVKQKSPDAFIIVEDQHECITKNKKVQQLMKNVPATSFDEMLVLWQRNYGLDPIKAKGSNTLLPPCISISACLALDCKAKNMQYYNAECDNVLSAYTAHQQLISQYGLKQVPNPVTQLEVIEDLKGYLNEIGDFYNAQLLERGYASIHKSNFLPWVERQVRYPLIAARTGYKLKCWKTIKHGFICQGAGHIHDIKGDLKEAGYTYIKSYGIQDIFNKLKGQNTFDSSYVVRNALNLREVFTQIFKEQESTKNNDFQKGTVQ